MGQGGSWCGARERGSTGACDARAAEIVRVDLVAHLGAVEGPGGRRAVVSSKAAKAAALTWKATSADRFLRTASSQEAEERWKATKAEWERQVKAALAAEEKAQDLPPGHIADADDEAAQERAREEERRAALLAIKREAEVAEVLQATQEREEGAAIATEALDRAARELEAHWRAIQEGSKLPCCAEEATDDRVKDRAEARGGEVAEASPGAVPEKGGPTQDEEQEREYARLRALAVKAFLSQHGFSGVNSRKRLRLRSAYPLHAAVTQGDAELVRFLLEEGADPRSRNSAGVTPLDTARRSGASDAGAMVEILGAAVRGADA